MRVFPRDLNKLFGQGHDFEQLLYDLVMAEARRHKLPSSAISWDPRTNVGDGGRDIVISGSHTDAVVLIPQDFSIWSAKSGKSDLTPGKLKAEIENPAHRTLRDHLDGGGVYVLCTPHPAHHDDGATLREAFVTLSTTDGTAQYRPEQFLLYSAPQICDALNRDESLIRSHFPEIAHLYNGCVSAAAWEPKDLLGPSPEFAPVGGRAAIIERIRAHLRSTEGPSLLHIGGLSGVGKSRLAHEAVRNQAEFNAALYVERFSRDTVGWLDQLKARDPSCVMAIVDETPLEEVSAMAARLGEDPRLRVVSIGPARRGERPQGEHFLVVSEPETTAEVLPIVTLAGQGLPKNVLESIADNASHDLRLALLLVKATQRNPAFINLPVHDGVGVWNRLLSLYAADLAAVMDFECNYPYLTLAKEIGYHEADKAELDSVADYFGVHREALFSVLVKAGQIGLGHTTPHFFEASPRALAIILFERFMVDRIRPRLKEFMSGVPPRLQRSIIQRCQELSGESRERADRAINDFFLEELGDKDITQLVDYVVARKFKAWAELDPTRGLRWLVESLEEAPDDAIALLDEKTTRGPTARRQLVWLCESLAAFESHFAKCEAVLFRLSGVETERGLGNNSTEIWKGLFLPVLSFTEVPFPKRQSLLLERLSHATDKTVGIIVDALIDALGTRFGGRCSPPRVVGGYLTPTSWMPESRASLQNLQRDLAATFLASIRNLTPAVGAVATRKAVENLGDFHRLGLLGELRSLLDHSGADLLGIAKQKASRLLTFYDPKEVGASGEGPGTPAELLAFERELAPTTLLERIEDIATQNTWDIAERTKWNTAEDATDPLESLANEIRLAPAVLAQCKDLFSSERVRSDSAIGAMCGVGDKTDALAATVESWLRTGICSGFVSGYFDGVAHRHGALPRRWSDLLDEAVQLHPKMAAEITLGSDHTQRGLHRLLEMTRSGIIQPAILYRLAFTQWSDAMDDAAKVQVVASLFKTPETVRIESLSTALKLGQVWGSFGKAPYTPDLSGTLQLLLEQAIGVTREADAWVDVMSSVGITLPQEAIGLATIALVLGKPRQAIPDDLLLPPLKHLAASHPTLAMNAIGDLLLDPTHRSLFGVLKFEGLFDSIGLDAVGKWATDKSADAIALLARHLDGPSITTDGPTVPPVADWLFQKVGTEGRAFAEFCAGRHAFEMRLGTAVERRSALEELVEPFLNHDRQWVRAWAEYELKINKEEEKWDALHEEDMERR